MKSTFWSTVNYCLLITIQILPSVINIPLQGGDQCRKYYDMYDLHYTCHSTKDTYDIKVKKRAIEGIEVWIVDVICDNVTDNFYTTFPQINKENVRLTFSYCPMSGPLNKMVEQMQLKEVSHLDFNSRSVQHRVRLHREDFKGLDDVQVLVLQWLDLEYLEADALADLSNLKWLRLKNNKIDMIPENFFSYTPELKTLELTQDEISVIHDDIFANLTKLELLNIWHNTIHNISANIFSDLVSIKWLDLTTMHLNEIPVGVFDNLQDMTVIALRSNNFTTLPEGLFSENKKLTHFTLSDNPSLGSLPQELLANLTELEEVKLNRNNITKISENVFLGSVNIKNITLSGNKLESIPKDLFKGLTSVTLLDLSKNRISSLPDGVFGHMIKLEILQLGQNRLTKLEHAHFKNLGYLQELYIHDNLLEEIKFKTFSEASNIEVIDLHNNNLTFEDGLMSPLADLKNLREADLSHNRISTITYDWKNILLKLRTLDLSYNVIQKIDYLSISFQSYDIEVDLTNNLISSIGMDFAESEVLFNPPNDVRYGEHSKYMKILLDHNPINCNCRIYHLLRYFENKLNPNVKAQMELVANNLTCISPPEFQSKQLTALKSSDVYCTVYEGLNNISCPTNCSCYVKEHDRSFNINCSNSSLDIAPTILPNHTRFTNTHLYLANNNLQEMPIDLREYANITFMDLSNNNISMIGWLPRWLQVLTLDSNNLSRIDDHSVEVLDNMTSLSMVLLYKNPWECDCQAANLLRFLQKNFKKLGHSELINCKDSNENLLALTVSDLCSLQQDAIIAMSVLFMLFGVGAGVVIALCYKYENELKVWMFAHKMCLRFISEEDLDKDKLYDAFVSYSHKDEDFVVNELIPKLEKCENPFKLCIHHREWLGGDRIVDQIVRSVENSRRTLVLLSPSFLESVWGKMEVRAAHLQALKEKREKLILVILEDLGPNAELEPELKSYMMTKTYIKYSDSMFWDKLRYALPHPPRLSKRGALISQRIRASLDDKLELINPLPPTPTVTTPPAESADTNPLVQKLNGGGFMNGGISNGGYVGMFNGSLKKACNGNPINGKLNVSTISNGIIVNTNSKQSDV